MASAVIAMQWENYAGGPGGPGIFRRQPLSFNSRQERFEQFHPGDRLWLVSRSPDDHQYYFVGMLVFDHTKENAADSALAADFGRYAALARVEESVDLGTSFPAEGLLRALQFESGRPIKYGASIGQSLQTLRVLDPTDDALLNDAWARSRWRALQYGSVLADGVASSSPLDDALPRAAR